MNDEQPAPTPETMRFSQAGLASVRQATPGPATVHPARLPVRLIDPAAIDVEALAATLARHTGVGVDNGAFYCEDCDAEIGDYDELGGDSYAALAQHQAAVVKAHLTGEPRTSGGLRLVGLDGTSAEFDPETVLDQAEEVAR